jgi:hypothetical protein
MREMGLATIVAAVAIALTATAHVDVDTDFANQVHASGFLWARDYNGWLAPSPATGWQSRAV